MKTMDEKESAEPRAKPRGFRILKPLDIPLIALAALLALSVGAAARSGDGASRVLVRGQDKSWIFPLDAEETLTLSGAIGETVVKISGGRAAIVSSPCAGQTCVAAGEIHRNGQWAACLPNGVFLLIEGTEGGDAVDAGSW